MVVSLNISVEGLKEPFFLRRPFFRNSIDPAAELLGRNSENFDCRYSDFAKIDLSSAYRSVRIHHDDYKAFGLK